jgi:transposase
MTRQIDTAIPHVVAVAAKQYSKHVSSVPLPVAWSPYRSRARKPTIFNRGMNELKRRYRCVLPVDVGIRKIATTIEEGQPMFYGKEIRETRGRYFRLRRSVGKGRIIKKWRHKERESVRHQVHTITRRIVDHARALNAIIAIGDPEGIRDNNIRQVLRSLWKG